MKRVAIVQSNYIPWKGYFDLIASVDEFVLYDDVQFTRRDWRNRNLIKTPDGTKWLTVPVVTKGRYHQTIRETEVEGAAWADVHWRTLEANYRRAPCFATAAALLKPLYAGSHRQLSDLNRSFLTTIRDYLGIPTPLSSSADYVLVEDRNERLASICEQAGATVYVSGPAARSYLDETAFTGRGIAVEWFDYTGYPEYPQLWGPFVHGVSVVDLLFNAGPDAVRYFRRAA